MVARQMLTQGIFTTLRFLWRISWKGTALAVPLKPPKMRALAPEVAVLRPGHPTENSSSQYSEHVTERHWILASTEYWKSC